MIGTCYRAGFPRHPACLCALLRCPNHSDMATQRSDQHHDVEKSTASAPGSLKRSSKQPCSMDEAAPCKAGKQAKFAQAAMSCATRGTAAPSTPVDPSMTSSMGLTPARARLAASTNRLGHREHRLACVTASSQLAGLPAGATQRRLLVPAALEMERASPPGWKASTFRAGQRPAHSQ